MGILRVKSGITFFQRKLDFTFDWGQWIIWNWDHFCPFQGPALFIYLSSPSDMFTDLREKGGERAGGRKTSMWETPIGCFPNMLGMEPQPRHVPWLGLKPTASGCTGQGSTQLSHLAKAVLLNFRFSHFLI